MDSTTTSTTTRRHCFIEEDDGLASIADMEAEFSGHNNNSPVVVSRPFHNLYCVLRRKSSLRNMACVSSPSSFVSSPRSGTSARFYDARFEDHQPHFLESCFLCKKPLGNNLDIFMYRGDTPFCSEECRQEQIEIDEAKEKNYNISASMKALRKKDQRKSTSPNKTSQDYSFRPSTVAAA